MKVGWWWSGEVLSGVEWLEPRPRSREVKALSGRRKSCVFLDHSTCERKNVGSQFGEVSSQET